MTPAQLLLVTSTSVFVSLSIVTVSVRLFTRLHVVKWVGRDDILIVIGAVAAVCCAATIYLGVYYGIGRHYNQVPQENYNKIFLDVLAFSVTYSVASVSVKLSILAFYLRLSVDERFRMVVYIIGIIVVAVGVCNILGEALLCIPFSKLWNPTQHGVCINMKAFFVTLSALNMVTDIIVYILPLRPLWKMRMPWRQKIALLFLLTLGGLLVVHFS
jgi:hypothetical protein